MVAAGQPGIVVHMLPVLPFQVNGGLTELLSTGMPLRIVPVHSPGVHAVRPAGVILKCVVPSVTNTYVVVQ